MADLLLGVGEPQRTAGRDDPACGIRTPRRTSTSPATPATCATARASSSATAATTRLEQPVCFPFGHGLSYTILRVRRPGRRGHRQPTSDGDLRLTVTCQVTNTGDRRGPGGRAALRARPGGVGRPPACASSRASPSSTWRRARPAPRRSTLTARDLSFWSETVRDWVLEAGEFGIAVGASSRDLRLSQRRRTSTRPRGAAPLGPMSSLEEWLDDPDGRAALRRGRWARATTVGCRDARRRGAVSG